MRSSQPDKHVAVINGVTIEYAMAGSGAPPIVLLNGAGGPLEGWFRVWESLGAISTVVAYNRPGIGRSTKPKQPQTGDVVVSTLLALLQELELEPPFIIVGHSLGGLFANLFARSFPSETAGVVLVESAAPEDAALAEEHGTTPPRFAQAMVDAIFGRHELDEAASVSETVRQIAQSGEFPHVPLVVVGGGRPARGMPAAVRDARARNQAGLASLSPSGRYVVAANSGHFPQMSEPKTVVEAVRSVFADAEAGNGSWTRLSDSASRLWDDYLASDSPDALAAAGASYSVWQFGYGVDQGDRLVACVLDGPKRATAGALWAYEAEGEAIPVPGDYSVVLDGHGVARCVIRTTRVDILPFDQVDAAFAYDEGEGDRSLEYWRDVHWTFFVRELNGLGREATLDMPVVCERFEVVYPASA